MISLGTRFRILFFALRCVSSARVIRRGCSLARCPPRQGTCGCTFGEIWPKSGHAGGFSVTAPRGATPPPPKLRGEGLLQQHPVPSADPSPVVFGWCENGKTPVRHLLPCVHVVLCELSVPKFTRTHLRFAARAACSAEAGSEPPGTSPGPWARAPRPLHPQTEKRKPKKN